MSWERPVASVISVSVLLTSLWGCAAVRMAVPVGPIPPQALALYTQALTLRSEGDSLRAQAKLEASVALSPDFVEAHRELQQIGIERLERGALQRRYKRFLADAPLNAARWYLLGRLLVDPLGQERAFEESLRLNPDFPWARAGLGFAREAAGERQAAREAWRQALEVAPEMRNALLGLLGSAAGEGRQEEVSRIARRLESRYGEDPLVVRSLVQADLEGGRVRRALEAALDGLALPGIDDAGLRRLGSLILERGTASDWMRATVVLRRTQDDHRFEVRRALGLLAVREGELGRAYRLLATLADPVPDPQVRLALRFVRVARGDYTVAIREVRADLPDLLGHDRLAVRYDRALRAGRLAEERPTAGRLLELARHLVSLGWTREALFILRRLRRDDGVGPAARRLLEEIRHHAAFVASLEAYFKEIYRRTAAGEEVPDLAEALDELGRIARWHLGRNVLDPLITTSFGPFGAFVDPRPASGSGLARYLDRFNQFIVVGQRAGGPPEAVLFDRLAAGELAGPWSSGVELIVTENQRIQAYVQQQGGSIAAAALVSFVYLDLDAVRREASLGLELWRKWGGELERIQADPLEEISSTSESLSLSEPLDLSTRLRLASICDHMDRGGSARDYVSVASDAILEHEKTHLLDARRFLPLTDDLLAKLWLLLRLGFSPFRVEAWLEERAQARALATARDPRLVLAVAASFLPQGRNASLPHSAGYAAMVRRLVEQASRAIERFPKLDPRKNILQQLRFLEPDELRWLGRQLVE